MVVLDSPDGGGARALAVAGVAGGVVDEPVGQLDEFINRNIYRNMCYFFSIAYI